MAYHKKIIDAIHPYGDQLICSLANICESLIRFPKAADLHIKSLSHPDDWTTQIAPQQNSLLHQIQTLRLQHGDDPYLRASCLSMELILYLSCPYPGMDLTSTAGELRDALSALPVRYCLFMDLVSCQLMLGAVAANEGSEVREWFVARIRRAVTTLRSRGWERPLEVLEKGFVSDNGLVARFRELWREVDS